jgi:calcineurin-like phosphoesterase family protein
VIHFTADTHFFHRGILSHRPWAKDLDDMHEQIIAAWNVAVSPTDTVYHLGDLSFASDAEQTAAVLLRLHGHLKIVPGNHDGDPEDNPKKLRRLRDARLLEVLPPLRYLKHAEYRLMLCHYPLTTWRSAHYGAWHLHGHSHGNLDARVALRGRRMDVGVDGMCNVGRPPADGPMPPYSFEYVREWMRGAAFEAVDHHVERA